MLKKLNIVLLCFLVVLLFFNITTYAAEDTELTAENLGLSLFKKDGYNMIHTIILNHPSTLYSRQAFVIYSKDIGLKDVVTREYIQINSNHTGLIFKKSIVDYEVVTYFETDYSALWTAQSTVSVSTTSSDKTVYLNDSIKSTDFIYSTANIYEGYTIFFQKTPIVSLPTIAPVQLEELEEKVTKTMGIITIIAVSCLALLISLPILLKTLRVFQAK